RRPRGAAPVRPPRLVGGHLFLGRGPGRGSGGRLGPAGPRPLERDRQEFAAADHALNLEAVADEILFVSGPVLVTALATLWIAPAGVLISGLATLVGALLFYPQKATEPAPRGRSSDRSGRVLTHPGIFIAIICQVFLGVV